MPNNNAQLLLLDAGTAEQLLEPDEVFETMKRAFSLHSRGEGCAEVPRLNTFVAIDLYAGLLSIFKGDPAGRLMRALDAVTIEGVSP